MLKTLRFLIYTAFILLLITGCSGKGNPSAPDTVIDPGDQVLTPELTAGREISDYDGSHFPLFHNLVYMNVTDPGNVEYEIVPLREGFMHLNILKFLEVSPCTDCFEIVGFSYPEPKVINVGFKITHPYDDPLYTIFDVRGIMMFDGSHSFPLSGMTISDSISGDGEFLNPDGFTSLYNTWLIGPAPPIQEYFQGVYASEYLPDALVNGYIRHISDDPSNTRNALLTGDSVTRTYSIKYPVGTFVFGYAVDASWAVPMETPVDDPMTDFGMNANSPEPWKIVITPFMEEMTDEGGTSWLQIDVYDYGGKETHDVSVVECPDLFDGIKNAGFILETDEFSRYHVALTNENLAPSGYYKCLISVQDIDYNPNFSWIDMKAYQVVEVRVKGHPVAVINASPNPQAVNQPVYFWGTDSYDVDNGLVVLYEWDWDNNGIYDETGAEVSHSWSTGGLHLVQLRVTDDDGYTGELDVPYEVTIVVEGDPANPVEIETDLLDMLPVNVYVDGDIVYLISAPGKLILLDITNPVDPVLISSVELPSGHHDIDSSPNHLFVTDGYAYYSFYGGTWPLDNKLLMIDVDPPEEAHIVSSNVFTRWISDIYVKDNYVYMGHNRYFKILDYTNPESPQLIYDLELSIESVWNGINYDICYGMPMGIGIIGNYLYVSELQPYAETDYLHKINIESPGNPVEEVVFEIDCSYMETYQDYLIYASGVGYWSKKINVWDPALEPDGLILTKDGFNNVGLWVDPIGVVGLRAGYLLGQISNAKLLDIDPLQDMHLASWFLIPNNRSHGQNGMACIINETSVSIVDSDPPEDAYIVNELKVPGSCDGVVIIGDYAYVQGIYGENYHKLKIFDIEPFNETHMVNEINYEEYIEFIGSMGNYILLFLIGGDTPQLQILDTSIPENPVAVNTIDLPFLPSDMAISSGYAYIVFNGYSSSELGIIDIAPVESAYISNIIQFDAQYYNVTASSGYVVMSYSEDGTYINTNLVVDVYPPEEVHVVNEFQLENLEEYVDIEVDGYILYILSAKFNDYYNSQYLTLVDLSNPESESIIKEIELPDKPQDIYISGSHAYLMRSSTFTIINKSQPQNAYIVSNTSTNIGPRSAAVKDNLLILSGANGLKLYELW